MDDFETEVNPVNEMSRLEDCPLAGLRTALSRQLSSAKNSDRQLALWRQARGGTDMKSIKTNRIEHRYSHEECAGTPLLAPNLPQAMPLTHQQRLAYGALKKQQRSLGLTAMALTKGLEMIEAPMKDVSSIANSLPHEEHKHNLLNAVHMIQEEALAPVGHALRFMAAGYNDLAIKRRDASAQAVRDRILQQQLKSTPLGFDSFLKKDISSILQTATARQQHQALTSAIRGGRTAAPTSSRSHDRSRSPVTVLDASSNYNARSSFRGRRPFRGGGGGGSRGGRGRANSKKAL